MLTVQIQMCTSISTVAITCFGYDGNILGDLNAFSILQSALSVNLFGQPDTGSSL